MASPINVMRRVGQGATGREVRMAIDRQGTGLAVVRIVLGVFFIFEGIGKIRWFIDSSILSGQLAGWMQNAAPGSIPHTYLERIAIPWVGVFARIVPLGEICSGLALLLGIWTPLFAFIAFFMALNFQIASGAEVGVPACRVPIVSTDSSQPDGSRK